MITVTMWLEYALLIAHSRASRLIDNAFVRVMVAGSFNVAMAIVLVVAYVGAVISLGRRGVSPARLASALMES